MALGRWHVNSASQSLSQKYFLRLAGCEEFFSILEFASFGWTTEIFSQLATKIRHLAGKWKIRQKAGKFSSKSSPTSDLFRSQNPGPGILAGLRVTGSQGQEEQHQKVPNRRTWPSSCSCRRCRLIHAKHCRIQPWPQPFEGDLKVTSDTIGSALHPRGPEGPQSTTFWWSSWNRRCLYFNVSWKWPLSPPVHPILKL